MRDDHISRISEELSLVIDILSENPPEHVFVLGDLIEDGNSATQDGANVKRVHEILQDSSFPVTYLLGNHDVENLAHEALANLLDQERFYGVVSLDQNSVVFLDSTKTDTDGARGELGAEQRNWLDQTLTEQDGDLILCHHPLGSFDISDNEWFSQYPERAFLSDRKETLDIIGEHESIRATISGHIHETQVSNFHGLTHVSVNAFSKELPDLPLTGTYAEVDLDERITVDIRVRRETVASYPIV